MEENQNRVCRYCGRPMMWEDSVCPYCGRKQPGARHRIFGKILKFLAALVVTAGILLGILHAAGVDLELLGMKAEMWFWDAIFYIECYRSGCVPENLEPPELEYICMPDEELDKLDMDALWRQPALWTQEYPDLTERQREAMEVVADELQYGGNSLEELVEELEGQDPWDLTREEIVKAAEMCQVDWNIEAIQCANGYLSFTCYSKKELAEQLEYNHFLPEQIQYAVENIDIDWEYEAELSAREVLHYGTPSRETLIQSLIEKGHSEQAVQNVIERLDVDWNQEALQSAERYRRMDKFTREEMVGQLVFEGFTQEQAEFAADALKLK